MPHIDSMKGHFEDLAKRSISEKSKLETPDELLKILNDSSWYQYELGNHKRCLELVHIRQRCCTDKASDMYAHFCSHAACAHFELHEVGKGQEQIYIAISIREDSSSERKPARKRIQQQGDIGAVGPPVREYPGYFRQSSENSTNF